MSLDVIFENEEILVVNKPFGLVVNKSQTTNEETLQDKLAKYFNLAPGDLGIGGRAGIVHRLDRETSGVLVIAKTQKTFDFLQNEFKNRLVKKEYIALVHGRAKDFGEISSLIARVGRFGKFGNLKKWQEGGREALTEYRKVSSLMLPISNFKKFVADASFNKPRVKYLEKNGLEYSLLSVFPKTGRTHQIRVHLKSVGNPVVSDLIYTPSKLLKLDLLWCPRLFLHSSKISFKTGNSKKQYEFKAHLPNDLKNAMLSLTG